MYLIYFFSALFLSLFFTVGVYFIMRQFQIVDKPRTEERKIHKKTIPLGGGLAIFASFFILVFLLRNSFSGDINKFDLLGLFLGGLIIIIGGILDDKYRLKAKKQIWFPVAAALIVVLFKIGPDVITNPFGGLFQLNILQIGNYMILANLLVFFWLISMMFTTKLLDGLDGLVTGVVSIGAIMIFFLSLQTQWYQPDVALLSILFAGACVGFLILNWHPAKIFLGEGGSLFTGFMLGCLAVVSGGKIATTLLVMGIPMLDIVRVVFLRIKKGKPIYVGDSEHLHFRLVQSGFSQKQAVLLFYSIAFLFGITTLFLQSSEKLIALIFLFVLMLLLGVWFTRKK
jgi:UDP-GlcNAc:undecaprenyl-phosphate/decaprenyl-phosphate GlcNAc-1-phosphate transferase